MHNTLVLGSTGFLGKALLKRLSTLDHQIEAPSKLDLNLLDQISVRNFFESQSSRFDLVFNFAANVGSVHYVSRVPASVISENVQMSLNIYNGLINANMHDAIVINPISNCSYPAEPGQNLEGKMNAGDLHASVQSYGAYKRALVALSECYQRQFGLASINVMFPGIFGPGDSLDPDHAHALNGMIVRAIQSINHDDTTFEIWGSGNPVRDWLFVDDAIGAILALIEMNYKEHQCPINVTAENHISVKALADSILNHLGSSMNVITNEDYPDGVSEKILVPGVFKELVPNFEFTPFDKAISLTIDAMKRDNDAKRI